MQEALTNAHKYGEGKADVALRFSEQGVEIAVSNAIDFAAPAGNGYGLVGMRERVEAVGGTLATGPSPDNARFDLVATIPAKTDS